jgi:hypothetical protein
MLLHSKQLIILVYDLNTKYSKKCVVQKNKNDCVRYNVYEHAGTK